MFRNFLNKWGMRPNRHARYCALGRCRTRGSGTVKSGSNVQHAGDVQVTCSWLNVVSEQSSKGEHQGFPKRDSCRLFF